MADSTGPLSRRALVLGALALTACSREGPGGEARPSPSLPTSPAPTGEPAETAAPGPTEPAGTSPVETESARAALPTREELIERYASLTPREWGTEVSGVVSSLADLDVPLGGRAPQVALTFDACGGGGAGDGFDETLIAFLREREVAATLFLNARWIATHASLAAELAADPLFLIACHGTRHVPLSVTGREAYGIAGTQSVGEVYDELMANVAWFEEQIGHPPIFFRPGTAHQDEVAAAVAEDLGMPIAGFSVNGDGGGTFSGGMVRDILLGVSDGDIVLAHMNRPEGGTAAGVAAAIPELLDQGISFVTMDPTGARSAAGCPSRASGSCVN